jgi:hypothetical protein
MYAKPMMERLTDFNDSSADDDDNNNDYEKYI